MNYRATSAWPIAWPSSATTPTDSKFQAAPDTINRECVGFYSVNCGSADPAESPVLAAHHAQLRQRRYIAPLAPHRQRGVRAAGRETATASIGSCRRRGGSGRRSTRRIPSLNYFDLSARFGVTENCPACPSGREHLDKKPPLVGNTIGNTAFNSGNTYPSTYDAVWAGSSLQTLA